MLIPPCYQCSLAHSVSCFGRNAERASEERASATGCSLLRSGHHGGGPTAPDQGKTCVCAGNDCCLRHIWKPTDNATNMQK